MIFETLKERANYFRDLAEHRLTPNSWYIIMLDGHSFSKKVKKRFQRPFDETFINAMNETAMHLCKKLQNVELAFVQSDEISLFCKDTPDKELEFGGRFCKIISLCASMATAHFNKVISKSTFPDDDVEYEFDCKVWNVPNVDEAYAWFRFRATDCMRNSINQFSESFLSHRQRSGINRDELKKMLAEEGHDWEQLPDDQKYGRLVYKVATELPDGRFRHKWTLEANKADTNFVDCLLQSELK